MARPREFNTEDAIQGAMEIFWRQGSRATNLPDLLNAMGLTRGSFYKAFGTKEAVYLAALDRYDQDVVSKTVAMLGACQREQASECLALMFQSDDDATRGCFICNAMVEAGPDSPEVADRTRRMTARLRDAIGDTLVRHNVFHDKVAAAATSDLILHLYFGHKAMGKGGQAISDWRDKLDMILAGAADL